ncbi:hypothetical protein BKA82DRAFT_3940937, partial [Pisolithus tinctorius]
LLHLGQAIISGSCALHLLLPQGDVMWSPHDVDVYATHKNVDFLIAGIKLQGYQIIHVTTGNDLRYSNSHVASIFSFVCDQCKINIIVSSSTTPISPIFQYHSTALMNFITHDSVFCAYPHLTLHQQLLVD